MEIPLRYTMREMILVGGMLAQHQVCGTGSQLKNLTIRMATGFGTQVRVTQTGMAWSMGWSRTGQRS